MFVFVGAEAEISLEMAMRGHYRGKLCYWEVDLVETLPPPIFEIHMRDLVGFLLVVGGNVGSSGPVSSSQLVVGAIFPACFSASTSVDIPMVDQAGKGTTPIQK